MELSVSQITDKEAESCYARWVLLCTWGEKVNWWKFRWIWHLMYKGCPWFKGSHHPNGKMLVAHRHVWSCGPVIDIFLVVEAEILLKITARYFRNYNIILLSLYNPIPQSPDELKDWDVEEWGWGRRWSPKLADWECLVRNSARTATVLGFFIVFLSFSGEFQGSSLT
jgi:hypothetical protein